MKSLFAACVGMSLCLVAMPAWAIFTIVPVARESDVAKQLKLEVKTTPNTLPSELEGTITFELRAPKAGQLQNIQRAILFISHGDRAAVRVPVELDLSHAGEWRCHFQLTPQLAKSAHLDLVCYEKDTPSGTIFRVTLSTFLEK